MKDEKGFSFKVQKMGDCGAPKKKSPAFGAPLLRGINWKNEKDFTPFMFFLPNGSVAGVRGRLLSESEAGIASHLRRKGCA